MWFEYEHAGKRESVPIPDAGGVVRVAVGEHGNRSSVWRIWANHGTSDVYVAPRTAAAQQKYSLHGTGDWRYAYTKDYFEELAFEDGRPRYFDRWARPEPDERGWIPGLSIWVRAEDVTPVASDDERGDIAWLPRPKAGHAVGVHLAIVHPDRGEVRLEGRLVDVLALADGTGLVVFANQRRLEPDEIEMLRRVRNFALQRSSAQASVGDRLALFGQNEGHRFVFDTVVTASDLQ